MAAQFREMAEELKADIAARIAAADKGGPATST
jgi:hypothetical protein